MSLNNMNNNMMMNHYMNMNNNPMMNQNLMPPKVFIMRQNTSPNMQMGQNMMNQQMQKIINMGNYQTGANNNKIGPNLQNGKYIQSNDLISESLISSGDNYKCTKDKNDLLNTLNSFLGQMEIQTKSFKKTNNIKDPVFELIQNEEKKEVINFFSKNKNNFMDKMFKYFSSQRMSISPNLASKVIDSENGYQIYQQKVDNLISILTQGKKHFQIKYLTVMVLGKSGVGKTSLINKILNINAPTGEGKFVTKETTPYISNAMPFLRLVDTRGIEIAQQFGIQKMEEEAVKFIDEQLKTGNYNNYVHCIWYCVSGKRFEDVEINALNRIRAFYQGNKIPIIMVYTQSVDEESIERLKKYILKSIDCNDFVKVLAHDIKSVGHQVIKSFGIEELISKTLARCKEALNGDMRAVMTNQIITKLEKELIIENNKIRKYIFERTILKFIKGYDVQSDDNFLKRIITIYGYNIHYYLGKDISEQTSSLIRDNDAIMNYAINYINYYKQYVESIIANELNTLAFKLLNIQSKTEKAQRMSTLIENKRDADDFIACNKQFFYDNFYFLAQRCFIGYFITNACEPLSKAFESNFNQIATQLLSQKEIRVNIDKCFWEKYKEFEEKLKGLNSKLPRSNTNTSTSTSTQKESQSSNLSFSNASNPLSGQKSFKTVYLSKENSSGNSNHHEKKNK
jgi:GTPase SAR1 family protein